MDYVPPVDHKILYRGTDLISRYDSSPERHGWYLCLMEEDRKMYLAYCYWNGTRWEEGIESGPEVFFWQDGTHNLGK